MSNLREFFKYEAAGGIVLLFAAILAIAMHNSPLGGFYESFLALPVEIRVGALDLDKPLILWINDGLMAIFFFLVGLEIKREILEGELTSPAQIALPLVAAVGGMVIPAAIYVFFNLDNPVAMQGWAIPAATDIAFALGILMLLGTRIPIALKIFLTAVAIFDDLGAIVIIAIFFSHEISLLSIIVAGSALIVAIFMNWFGVIRVAAYVCIGVIMWVAVLKSGVHATLAGVIIAMTVPLNAKDEHGESPLKHLEHTLHPWIAFVILPVFAFANAGVDFSGMSISSVFEPITLGITAGLFVGKQIGVFGAVVLMVGLGLARLPEGCSWGMMYGAAILCGIGFTMSLFIGGLAFGEGEQLASVRLGVIIGSVLAGIAGYLLLRFLTEPRPVATEAPA